MRAAYVRISSDPLGYRAGVERQRQDCTTLAARLWPGEPLTFFEDNDVSAYSGATREQFKSLCDLVAGHRVTGLVAYNLDRLFRQPRELESFLDLCAAVNLTEIHTCEGDLDLSSHDGQLQARILVAVARKASDDQGRRVRRAKRASAEQGRRPSGPRPFGYRYGPGASMILDPDEAGLIRTGADMLLRGHRLAAVRDTFVASGIAPPRASAWSLPAVRAILMSPRIAGLSVHRGEIVGTGQWPAIVTTDEHERLTGLLARHRTARGGPRQRTRLLGGLLHCGLCGRPMVATTATTHGGGQRDGKRTKRYSYPSYRCSPSTGCGRVSVSGDLVDEWVVRIVVARLESTGMRAPVDSGTAGIAAELADAEERLAVLTSAYGDGGLTIGEWRAARGPLIERIGRLRGALDDARSRGVLADLAGPNVAETWTQAPIRVQAAVIAAMIERIDVLPWAGVNRGPGSASRDARLLAVGKRLLFRFRDQPE